MAHRNLAPVRALTRDLIPIAGSFILDDTKATLDLATLGDGKLDTVIEAMYPGALNNDVTFEMRNSDTNPATLTLTGTHFVLDFKSGTTDVTEVEALISGLAGAEAIIAVKTGGTGVTKLGTATISVATPMAGGVEATAKGLGFTVSHAIDAVGTYTVQFTDKFPVFVACKATLQLAAADDKFVVVGPYDASAKTLKLFLWDKSDAALVEVAANADNRLNFVAYFSNTSAMPSRG